MRMRTSKLIRSLIVVEAAFAGLALAGPLDPPAGPVASSYKTLAEVEPRIALSAKNTPGDLNSFYRISQPGSYYLTGNVEGLAFEHGIEIALTTEGLVTIDLSGYSLIGRENSLSGIAIEGLFKPRVVVRNGFITMWDGSGIDLPGAETVTVERVESTRNFTKGFVVTTGTFVDCKAQYNSTGGFKAGSFCTFTRCEANTTGIGFETDTDCRFVDCAVKGSNGNGFDVDSNCTLINCTATNNTGYGILTFLGCTLLNCTSSNNGEAGYSTNQSASLIGCVAQDNAKWGFSTGSSSVFQSCVARGNGYAGFSASFSQVSECLAQANGDDGFALGGVSNISKSTAISNDGNGISGGGVCLVVECSALYNDEHGIWLTLSGNTIRGNLCTGNGQGATPGAGIRTEGVGNRIEDNHCRDNDIGLSVTGVRSIIVRNVCGTNTTNWSIAAGNSYGPIVDRSAVATGAVNGNSAAAALGSTDPSANFTN